MSLCSLRGRFLVPGVLVAGVLGGYFVGTMVEPSRVVLRGNTLLVQASSLQDTVHTVPVTFTPGKWSPRLLVTSPEGVPDSMVCLTDRDDASIEFRYGASSSPPQHVYFQMWDGFGDLRDVRYIDRNALTSLTRIYCYEGLGIQFEPANVGQRVEIKAGSGIGVLDVFPDVSNPAPDKRHVIQVMVRQAKCSAGSLMVFGPALRDGVVSVSPKECEGTAEMHVGFSRTSQAAQDHYVCVVRRAIGGPAAAFCIKGEDLLSLDAITIDEQGSRSPVRLSFSPQVPVDIWILDGGTE